ncbi:phage protein, partial [Xanthomonas hortorum pv. pelargonii]
MRDRQLTGPWAGFSFVRGELVTPEGKAFTATQLT